MARKRALTFEALIGIAVVAVIVFAATRINW